LAFVPEVLIVGRPNVGKSTLFNRLAGKSLALVDNQPGSTRDFKSQELNWDGKLLTITDSGGWVPGEKESIAQKVGEQIDRKIKKVSALLFVVDAIEGVTRADEMIARNMRKYGLPTWLLVNKSDRYEKNDEVMTDFMQLGFEKIYAISAEHGIGVDDFLDDVTDFLEKSPAKPHVEGEKEEKLLRIAILGKPNVGKSSLVNAILGEKRLIVDDLPGTTHDAIPVIIETEENPLVMVDTAGIRMNKQQDTNIEQMSVEQSLYELQTCQVAIFIVDGELGITHQDVTISKLISQAFRPVIILINKWDIHHKAAEQATAERITKRQLRYLHFAPVMFISAKTGLNLDNVLPMAYSVYEESCRQVPTRKVNLALQDAVSKQNPPYKNGHRLKLLYGYQRMGHPPAFEIFANQPGSATPSYMRYLEAEIRKAFDMPSTPMQLVLKQKVDKKEHSRSQYKRNFDVNADKRKKKQREKRGDFKDKNDKNR
jgi:GTP-binding protein